MSNVGGSASAGGSAGKSAGNVIKEGVAKVHGTGEAIRGNINAFADTATGTDSAKSDSVAARGVDEIETGKYQGTGVGVTPHDTARERLNRDIQGEGGHIGTGNTTYGSAGGKF